MGTGLAVSYEIGLCEPYEYARIAFRRVAKQSVLADCEIIRRANANGFAARGAVENSFLGEYGAGCGDRRESKKFSE